jgi:hypothetical protein
MEQFAHHLRDGARHVGWCRRSVTAVCVNASSCVCVCVWCLCSLVV